MLRNKWNIYVSPGLLIGLAISVVLLPIHWIVSWIFALMIHEFCHYAALRMLGGRVYDLKLTAFGAQMKTDVRSNIKQMISIFAGPLGGISLFLFRRQIPIVAICGTLHSIFNLLPLENLDGGAVLLRLLRMWVSERHAVLVCQWIDRVCRIVITVVAAYISFQLLGFTPALLALCLLFAKQKNAKYPCNRDALLVQYI